MAATNSRAVSHSIPRVLRKWWFWALAGVPVVLIGASLWLTEPLDKVSARPGPQTSTQSVLAVQAKRSELSWPESRLEGDPAKRLALDFLLRAAERLDGVSAYTATFRKRERIKGKLGPEQTIEMKVRHKPFAIYLKFLAPRKGKEIIYAEGKHDNKLIAHNGDWSRRLIPRLKLAPDDPIALADNRHPITEAGLSNLTRRLVGFRRMDLRDERAETVLDRVNDVSGGTWFRSVHSHSRQTSERPFARVEVLYDPETKLPVRIVNYDWPEPGHVGELSVAEDYHYSDLRLDAPLTDLDFDPANPAYAFTRY